MLQISAGRSCGKDIVKCGADKFVVKHELWLKNKIKNVTKGERC